MTNPIDDLENKLKICEKVFHGHSYKQVTISTIYQLMIEMDEAFITAYHRGDDQEKVIEIDKQYRILLYDFLLSNKS